jgi:hypothetical protein
MGTFSEYPGVALLCRFLLQQVQSASAHSFFFHSRPDQDILQLGL